MKKIDKKKAKKVLYITAMLAMYITYMYLKSKYESDEELIVTPIETESNDDTDEVVLGSNGIEDDNITLEVQFVDVGQADCILIRVNDDTMLIDAGNNEDGEKLVKYFKELGIKEFEYVVGTHPHEDHIGGMDDIIDNFDIGTFYMPEQIITTKTYEDVLDSLAAKDYYLDTPEIGYEFNLGEAELKVLYVGNDKKDLNDTSIVLRMDYDEISYLFMGDASTRVEKEILADEYDVDVDVLKVGHHGSKTATSKTFLDAVDPQYGIIQVGVGNTYNLPTEIVLNRLMDRNIEIYRNDEDGTIITETDGKSLTLRKVATDTNGN